MLGQAVSLTMGTTSGSGLYLAWPSDSEGFVLETSAVLGTNANWQPVTSGVLTNGGTKALNFTPPVDRSSGYFRLRKP